MNISYYNTERIKRILLIALLTALVITFFAFAENKNLEDIELALLVGFIIGIAVGILEEFIFVGKFRKVSLIWTIILKSSLYTLGIGLFFVVFVYLFVHFESIQYERFVIFLTEGEFFRAVLYTFIAVDFVMVFNQYQKFLGNDVLFFYTSGKYQKPEHEERIFMFLDISSSTELAEIMEPDQYFSFINDFFHDLSEPILRTSAKIYQYVGDEVVFTWKLKEGIKNNNCVKLFFLIKEEISNKRNTYLKKYGRIPEYKAGLHFGEVIAAVVGDIKKELIYNGDVLNTTSRIRSYCTEVNEKFLVSAELVSRLTNLDEDYLVEPLGISHLKGKKNIIGLFKLDKKESSIEK
ncbi:MAG: adenylate/guanylate cyclase domain-containing protein [Melioribacteraceae bacterium]|nr:adenylate/guanylate cyclase domain-containing protein [Melioribacteraceae bacterium]